MNFVRTSLDLFKAYNRENLIYNGGLVYDKLITASPFYVSSKQLQEIKLKSSYLWDLLEEQENFFDEIFKQDDLKWAKELYEKSLSPKTLKYLKLINSSRLSKSEIIRIDLSSLPFGCHEAQLRWGIAGHIHYVNKIFDEIVPVESNTRLINHDFLESIRETIGRYVLNDDECCIFMSSNKYTVETEHFISTLESTYFTNKDNFNSETFRIENGNLVHKESGKIVRIVFRRELTLESLLETEFGENIVKIYLEGKVHFEPGLSLHNDSKLQMVFPFDKRSHSHFSDNSRSIFLRTSFYDNKLRSFNGLFNKDYKSLEDLFEKTTASQRKYIFKYGGSDLDKSFGAGSVYRLDRSAKLGKRVIDQSIENSKYESEWILQEMDQNRFKIEYLRGNYFEPASCTKDVAENCVARLMIMVQKDQTRKNSESKIVNITSNFVTDHWKARLKTSNSVTGQGAILTGTRELID